MVNVDPSRSFAIVGSSMLFGKGEGICKLNAPPLPDQSFRFDNEKRGVIHVIAATILQRMVIF